MAYRHRPVSYTHLDVYKRQLYGSESGSAKAGPHPGRLSGRPQAGLGSVYPSGAGLFLCRKIFDLSVFGSWNQMCIRDRFYTSQKSSADARRGVGLGLAICSDIIKAHGGSISAQNRESGGAEFIFTLPVEEECHE